MTTIPQTTVFRIPIRVLRAAFLCVVPPGERNFAGETEADNPLRAAITRHVHIIDSMCVATNGVVLLKQNLHGVPGSVSISLFPELVHRIEPFKNMDHWIQIEILESPFPAGESRVHVRLPDGKTMGVPATGMSRAFQLLREVMKKEKIQFPGRRQCSLDPYHAAFSTKTIRLVWQLAEMLNANDIGVVAGDNQEEILFHFNPESELMLMPIHERAHPWGTRFSGDKK